MTRKEYNGWTNYETWLVKLWMDNDEGSYRYWVDMAEQANKDNRFDADGARRELAKQLESEHDDIVDQSVPDSGFIRDLINGAMSEVNWWEIANSLLEDNCEDFGKEEETEETEA